MFMLPSFADEYCGYLTINAAPSPSEPPQRHALHPLAMSRAAALPLRSSHRQLAVWPPGRHTALLLLLLLQHVVIMQALHHIVLCVVSLPQL